ncbi:MAG: putative molybdenum carrier protein [Pirellulales bacterium]
MLQKTTWHGVDRIVSGGQTGVDRAALDVARELGMPHGGWCPAGRRAEDGPIARHYRLLETETQDYAERTERNVIDSEGTLILCRGPLTGGTRLTRKLARRHGRPLLVVDLERETPLADVVAWLHEHGVTRLNVAGPRESTQPGIGLPAAAFLRRLFTLDEASEPG